MNLGSVDIGRPVVRLGATCAGATGAGAGSGCTAGAARRVRSPGTAYPLMKFNV